MYASEPLRPIRYRDIFLIGLLIIAGLIYLVIWINTGDALWFLPHVADRAIRIVLYDAGRSVVIEPGSPGFEAINAAVNEVLSRRLGYRREFGLSDATRERYYTRDRVIEVFYARPIKLHSPYRIGKPTSLLIPLEGRHADQNVIFTGANGVYWPGALTVASTEPIKRALAEYGY